MCSPRFGGVRGSDQRPHLQGEDPGGGQHGPQQEDHQPGQEGQGAGDHAQETGTNHHPLLLLQCV